MGRDKKINICHIASGDLWAGAEVQLYTLLRAMKSVEQFDLSVVLLNPGKLADKITELDLPVKVLDESRLSFTQIRSELIDHLRDKQIDLIHSHRYKENILAAMVQKKIGARGLIRTVHGLTEKPFSQMSLKEKLQHVIVQFKMKNKFDKIICVSDDICRRLTAEHGSERLVTIHNALDIDTIKPAIPPEQIRIRFEIPHDRLLIGTVGRMVPVKGYDLLLQAFAQIAPAEPRATLVFAGDGPLQTELEHQAQTLGVFDQVKFIGFCDDIINVVNSFDLFVMSSRHEGIPMSLLEAMALARPVVLPAVGGLVEVVENNRSGILVPAADPNSLAQACLELLSDPDRAQTLGENGQNRIRERFSTEMLEERMTALYQTVARQS